MKKLRNNARGYILDMFAQHHMVKRTVLSFLSIVIMGFGTALFNVSGFGVDPFTSMNMSVAAVLGVSFGTYQLIINAVILLYVVIVAHRGLVGVGTVFNMAGVGYSCELFSSLLMPMVKQNDTLSIRIPLLLAGILVLCFACSLFFTANIGVGPYDALGFMLSRFAKLPYKWVRVLTDVTVVSIGLLVSGGTSGRSVTQDEAVLVAMREQTLEELARECAEKFMTFGVTPTQAAQLLLGLETKKEE